jgi:tetratricopeptide (TPR) repeat protein
LNRRISAGNAPFGSKLTTLIKLGTINMRLGKEEEAEKLYEQALTVATGPLDLPAYDPLVRIGSSLNRPEEKQARDNYFRRALDSADGPGDSKADAYKKVGDTLNTSKEYQEALSYLQQAETLYATQETKLAATFRSIALSYERMGNKDKALEYYRRALALYQKLKMPSTISSVGYKIRQLEEK